MGTKSLHLLKLRFKTEKFIKDMEEFIKKIEYNTIKSKYKDISCKQ